jgi:hypothetical protein
MINNNNTHHNTSKLTTKVDACGCAHAPLSLIVANLIGTHQFQADGVCLTRRQRVNHQTISGAKLTATDVLQAATGRPGLLSYGTNTIAHFARTKLLNISHVTELASVCVYDYWANTHLS